MAGPWFTVLESGTEWHPIDTLLISDGGAHERARLEIRIELEEANS